jgi:hypothetical protein
LTRVAEALEGVKDEASATRGEGVISTERKALQALSPLPAPPPPEDGSIQASRRLEAQSRYLAVEKRVLRAVLSLQKRALAGREAGEKGPDKSLNSILARVRDYLKEADRVTGRAKTGNAGKPGE